MVGQFEDYPDEVNVYYGLTADCTRLLALTKGDGALNGGRLSFRVWVGYLSV